MIRSDFTRKFLLLFSGAIIWAIHFLMVYSFAGVVCARPAMQRSLMGIEVVVLGVTFASLAAIGLIALICWRLWYKCTSEQRMEFLNITTVGMLMLAAVAIVWEALPVFFLPSCRWMI